MKPVFVIVEKDKDGNCKFFNGVLTKSSYNKDVKIRVYKYRKTAQNNLDEYKARLAWGLENNRNNAFRDDLGELEVVEYIPKL